MGILRENEERVVDRLLRAEFRRPGAEPACTGFDPDLAAAYVEKSIPAFEAGRFEEHLAQCTPCRTGVARLVLLESVEASAEVAFNGRVAAAATPSLLQRLFAGLAQPKWALAATAVVALAVAIPVLMRTARQSTPAIRERGTVAYDADAPRSNAAASADSADESKRQLAATTKGEAPAHGNAQAGPTSGFTSGDVSVDKKADDSPKPAVAAPAANNEAAARAAGTSEPKKPDAQPAQPEGERAELAQSKAREVGATPPAPKEENKKLGPIDETLTVSEDRTKTESRLLKPGTISDKGDSSDKERTAAIKSEVVARAPAASSESAGKVVARRSDERGRKQAEKDAAGSSYAAPGGKSKPAGEKKEVGKKTFQLIDGIWTDKDYSRNKEMPGVTLIRDSDLYKEAVTKDATLKAFVDAFGPDETVVVVHKRTAYKITPRKPQ